MMRYFFGIVMALIAALSLITGCVVAPTFDDVPSISNARLDLGSNPVNPYDTSVVFKVDIRFDFSDGDGDLGRLPSDSLTNNIFLVNEQLVSAPDTFFYSLEYIPPHGGVPDITGTVKIQLQQSTFDGFCIAGPLDEVNFDIWIEDRAGRKSNVIAVPSIPLDCD
ncbi:MAG: hypothetical protein GY751_06940 [Bacteroidetes bacterium]|nr:hypothetical protein [Bacteroidota bacterium]